MGEHFLFSFSPRHRIFVTLCNFDESGIMCIVREQNYVTGFVHYSKIPRIRNPVVYVFQRRAVICHYPSYTDDSAELLSYQGNVNYRYTGITRTVLKSLRQCEFVLGKPEFCSGL